jgi:hypothetical protein
MPSSFAHAYVHRDSIGDLARCQQHIQQTEPIIDGLYQAGQLEGYQLLLIETADEAADELVLVSRVAPVTAGRFPYVYTRVQLADGVALDIDTLLADRAYTRVDPGP